MTARTWAHLGLLAIRLRAPWFVLRWIDDRTAAAAYRERGEAVGDA